MIRAGQLWPHLLRAVRWQPIVAGAALAGALGRFASHADATMLALLMALGASFVLDDPAAVTLASSPSTLWWRRRVCLAFVLRSWRCCGWRWSLWPSFPRPLP